MCYFEQTQYLACGHNVEAVTEKCELGERYRTSMHDKIITALHSDDGQCEKCSPPPAYVESANGVTSDLPDATSTAPDLPNGSTSGPASGATSDSASGSPHTTSDVRYPLVDLTEEPSRDGKKPPLERRDSMGDDLMDFN